MKQLDQNRPLKLGVIGARGVGNVQGGIERYCTSFYKELPPDRFDVTIFVSRRARGDDLPPGIHVIFLPVPRVKQFEKLIHSLASIPLAFALGIRTLHIHGIGSCLALPIAWALGMRTTVRHIGADYNRSKWGPIARWMLRLGEHCAARFGDSVVCLNRQIADEFSRVTGRTERIFIVPNGVAEPPANLCTDVLDQIGIKSGGYVLAVGRLVAEKNIHLLLEAFSMADLPFGTVLVIAGAPDYNSSYSMALLNRAQKSERIVMVGTVFGDNLSSLYRHAGLFVLPSLHEGMSFSLLEAGITGVKIVASDIPANSVVCRDFARLSDISSAESLAKAIALEWHRERPADEVQRQIAFYKSLYDWAAIARAMEPILTQQDSTTTRNWAFCPPGHSSR